VLNCCLLLAAEAFGMVAYAQTADQQNPLPASPKNAEVKQHSSQGTVASDVNDDSPKESPDYNNSLGLHFLKNFALDQEAIWTSPAHLRLVDTEWLIPLGLAISGSLATDTEFSKHLSNSPSRIKDSNDFANYGIGAMAGVGGGLYVWGQITHDDHMSETGVLAGEAAVDSLGVTFALGYTLGRQRPLTNNYRGEFWQGGDSLPSDHAAAAWSMASVIAHEYPGALTQIMAYGMASAISVSRLTGKQHFPTDVLIGSAIGWFVGQHVYRAHHDPELGGSDWQTFAESRDYDEVHRPSRSIGSPFVPLDSWVYPALNKLAGLGYVATSMAGMQPWTRIECAHLTEEAGEALQSDQGSIDDAAAIQASLAREFSYEIGLLGGGRNLTANLESVYARAVSISGPALTDGFHFGQTISYDFGRPFERGTNGQAGGSFYAADGPLAIYIRAEYQHAPSAPAPSEAVRNIIALRDSVPEPPATPVQAINRPQLLDAYLALNLDNWQISVGKQSLSWAPGPGASLLWSDNSEPVNMVRVVNPEAVRLPSFLKYLGPAQIDQFIGMLAGGTINPHRYIYGQKINFKPLQCLELGFGRTVTLGGKGADPFTPKNFLYSAFGQTIGNTGVPGDSHSGFDWTFYVPKVRNLLVFYGEMYADDDPVPWFNPPKNPFRPGIYITRIPGIPKLDFHMEAVSTESPGFSVDGQGNHGNLNYWNSTYRDGYTNNGNLIGNTVGRDGRSIQTWLGCWISPRNTLQFIYKHNSVSPDFIPGGGAWQDYGLQSELHLKAGLYEKTLLQYEHISHYPILFNGTQRNFTAALEVGFSPQRKE
jgi:hypothetical protein